MIRPLRDIPMLVVASLFAGGATAAEVVTLRPAVSVSAASVTLKDIATLEGDYARSLGDVEVLALGDKQADATLNGLEIRRRLSDKGANWGKLVCRGVSTVKVTRIAEKPAVAAASPAAEIPKGVEEAEAIALANPIGALNADPSRPAAAIEPALRVRLVEWIHGQIGADLADEDLQVTFEKEQDALLARTFTGQRLEIEPLSRTMVGKLPIVIRCYQGDKLTDTLRIRSEVKLRKPVLVCKKLISRGQTITESDLELQPTWLDSTIKAPLTATSAVVGQRAVSQVRPGAVLGADDVAAALLVQRGQMVTVRCVSGALVLKTVGRASSDGASGQIITLKNDRTGQEFQARVCGPQEAVMLLESEPASPTAAHAPQVKR
jgi:flagella basal body P-ring formation protein FlgA